MASRGSEEYKEACRVRAQKYRAANPERAREINRACKARHKDRYQQEQKEKRANNPGICAAYRRKHYLKHRDAILQKQKNLSDEQREKKAARKKRWDSKNTDHMKEYVRANKEKISQRTKHWYELRREHILAVGSEWRSKNRSRVNLCAAQRRANNPEQERAKQREYNKRHPEKRRISKQIRRARKRNATVGDTKAIAAWERKWRKNKTNTCHWCKKKTKTIECHADHVHALAKGGEHSVENLVVSCARCNQVKNCKPPEVFNKQLEQPLLFI